MVRHILAIVKLICCSDLHGDPVKYEGIAAAAEREKSELIVCAGDMVDDASNRAGQTRYVDDFIRRSKTPWAVCSGNHDFDYAAEPPSAIVPDWLCGVGTVEDGQTKLVGELVVTTIPWPLAEDVSYRRLVEKIVNAGKSLAEKYQWLIIIHSPPSGGLVGDGYIDYRAELTTEIIKDAKPDFLIFGHLHYPCEYGSWLELVHSSICVNAGQSECGAAPQYVVLDITNTGGWKADHSHF